MRTLTKVQMSAEFPRTKKGKIIPQKAGMTYLSGCAIHGCPLWMQGHIWQPECILSLTLGIRNFPLALFHVNEKVFITSVCFVGIFKQGVYPRCCKHGFLFKGTYSSSDRAKLLETVYLNKGSSCTGLNENRFYWKKNRIVLKEITMSQGSE